MVLPLVGDGSCELKLRGVDTKITTDVDFKEVEGREIIYFEKMNVTFKVKAMKVNFQNLFNGNKVLGLTMNNFLNQNAIEILNELEDSISSSLSVIFLELINNVFSKIPTDLWLLNDGDELAENSTKAT